VIPRAVVDTNVLVSGIYWKGAPFDVLTAWESGRFRLVVSPPILDEYQRVLEDMAQKRRTQAHRAILELIELHAEMVAPVSFARSVCSDPDDDKFLEAAIAANAEFVVSGDKALLAVKRYQGVEVLRPAPFLSRL